MKADIVSLTDFLGSNKTLFKIPVYQRNYEWREEQCCQLFTDLAKAGKTQKGHFLGTIVYVEEKAEQMGHIDIIIDGQQRLTSCMLLLKALSEVLPQYKIDILETYLTNRQLNINDKIKLQPVDKDLKAFKCIMADKADMYDKPSKIIENYHLFQKLLSNKEKEDIKNLFEAMNYLKIVYIALDNNKDSENPQLIFESLNSTGVSLNSADLIRNFILMQLSSEEQNRLYKEYWAKIQVIMTDKKFDEFVRHYLMMRRNKLTKSGAFYQTYKEYYNERGFSAQAALSDLYTVAKYYSCLLNASDMPEKMNTIIANINIMRSTTAYPYLLKLLDLQAQNQMTWQQIEEIGILLEGFLYRRLICSVPSNGLNTLFLSALSHLNLNDEYNNLKKELLEDKFPKDRELKNALLSYPLYGKKNYLAKLTLTLIEEHRSKEYIDFNNAQIEHIMPQRLSNDWKIQVDNAESVKSEYGNTIGNLTLTKYNQEMGNKIFSEKKKIYRNSNITLTREIALAYNNWGRKEILDRASRLADEMIEIFARPILTQSETKKEISGEHSINDEINITGVKPLRLTIKDNVYSVKSWTDCLIIFLNYVWENNTNDFALLEEDDKLSKSLFNNSLVSNSRSPKRLQNGQIIETNFSASNIVALIAKMAEICGIDDEITYII